MVMKYLITSPEGNFHPRYSNLEFEKNHCSLINTLLYAGTIFWQIATPALHELSRLVKV